MAMADFFHRKSSVLEDAISPIDQQKKSNSLNVVDFAPLVFFFFHFKLIIFSYLIDVHHKGHVDRVRFGYVSF